MLEIKHITKNFLAQQQSSNHLAVQDLNLTIQKGEFFSLLGPSGCGKSTLLRMISGIETPTSGQLVLNGKDITQVPSQQRPFNMVFQRYALFPHLSVFDNIAFGLNMKKVLANEVVDRVQEVLKLVNLEQLRDRMPETLSGGQQQRVAVARALVNRPQILLLDEPLSALDQKMRQHMQVELRDLQKRLGLTFIYVTHDQEEAFALSDRVAVMNQGKLEQVSSPEDLYNRPETLFVAKFVGATSELPALGSEIRLVRPENFLVQSTSRSNVEFSGQLLKKIFRGTHYEVEMQCQGQRLLAKLTIEEARQVSSDMKLYCSTDDIMKFPTELHA